MNIELSEEQRRQPTENLEQKFRRLADVWIAETAYVSSTNDLVSHPAFLGIVGMGSPVIPLLLRQLQRRQGHWHRALRRITGMDPVPPTDRGNIAKTAEAWLRIAHTLTPPPAQSPAP
ncbi:MAG TPA: hypothetical protein VMS17_24455 [Gemmataceae bacterium]|nr:hypothetical protein [Gemmataceae bacterium]